MPTVRTKEQLSLGIIEESRHDYFKRKYGGNGNLNKVFFEDSTVHNWYRFVLSFPPHLVREYLSIFGAGRGKVVLDPFCGTGTTLVEAKKLGLDAIGIEAHPTASFASAVKTNWEIDPINFLDNSKTIFKAANRTIEKEKDLRSLNEEETKLLLKGSISPVPLHKAIILKEAIEKFGEKRFIKHQLLSLSKILVYSVSNLHFGPEVGVRGSKKDSDVTGAWLKEIELVAKDLSEVKKVNYGKVQVKNEDARRIKEVLPANSVDIVITSPPYPNEKDYTRTTRLETVVLGFARTKDELRAIKKGLVRSNTRSVYKEDNDDKFVKENNEIQRIARDIEKRRVALGKTSGFERMYARVSKLYFGGMAKHFADLRSILKSGAILAYVVGDQASYLRVMIRTGQILAEIAESLGYEVVNIDLFRTRLATATKEQLREEVLILRWPGK